MKKHSAVLPDLIFWAHHKNEEGLSEVLNVII